MSPRLITGVLAVAAGAAAVLLWARSQPLVDPPPVPGSSDRAASGAGTARGATAPPAVPDRVLQATSLGTVALRGTVRIENTGEPVTAGSVVARFIDCAAHGIEPASLLGRDADDLEPCSERPTDIGKGGCYEIEVPGRAFLIGLAVRPPDAVDVPGVTDGVRFSAFEPRDIAVRETVTAPDWRRDLEVSMGAVLKGFVVDRAGAPVPSALVLCAHTWMSSEPSGAHTDARGSFAVTGLRSPPGIENKEWWVQVSCEGYLARELDVRLDSPAAEQLVIELTRGVVVSGRVVGPLGQSVDSVQVQAVARGGERSSLGQLLQFIEYTLAGTDGSFAFSLAPAASVSLLARGSYLRSAAPEAWAAGTGALPDVAATRDAVDLRIHLQPMVSFRVLAVGPDGTAVPGTDLVVLVKITEGWERHGASFLAAPGVEHEIRVLAPQPRSPGAPLEPVALRAVATCMAPRADDVVDVPVQLQRWEFVLPPPPTDKIEGEGLVTLKMNVPGVHARSVRELHFVDAVTGQRLARRRVEIRQGGGGGGVLTSSLGRLRLELGPGLVDLMILVDGYRPQGFRIDSPAAGYQEIEVRLQPAR